MAKEGSERFRRGEESCPCCSLQYLDGFSPLSPVRLFFPSLRFYLENLRL